MRKLFFHPERNGYFIALGCIFVSTVLFLPGRDYFAKEQWALLYLLIISLVAGICGVHAAVLASVLAFLAWDFFFLPPYGTFWIVDPKDWLALLVFLIVGVTMGIQTGRMREREARAIARERETALLNDVSSSLVSITQTRAMAEMLLQEIARFSEANEVSLWLPDASGQLAMMHRVVPVSSAADPHASVFANWAFLNSKAIGLPVTPPSGGARGKRWPISVVHDAIMHGAEHHDLYIPLQTAICIEGVLQIAPAVPDRCYTAHEAQLLVSTANLAAAFLERQRLQVTACKAEMLQEVDTLKTTLVSSVSHELKTPLAAITATVTNLLADDVAWTVTEMRDQLRPVEGNLERLHDNIGALLDVARLESQVWKTQFDRYELDEVIDSVLEKLQEAERTRVELVIPDEFPSLMVDCRQLARALQHLLENALVYAPSDAVVRFGALATAREIRLWVEDSGPGIPPEEQQRIFEKFYRGTNSGISPQGTGLGLAIAAEIVRFHQGRLWVEDVQPHGARFVMTLPIRQG
jgi:two-component system sensor histidine kinase KdpD